MSATVDDTLRNHFVRQHGRASEALWDLLHDALHDVRSADIPARLARLSDYDRKQLLAVTKLFRRSIIWATSEILTACERAPTRPTGSTLAMVTAYARAIVHANVDDAIHEWTPEEREQFDRFLAGPTGLHRSVYALATEAGTKLDGYSMESFVARVAEVRAERTLPEAS